MHNKKILGILLILTMVPLVLAVGNERVIATQNQLQNQLKTQYQLSTGQNINVEFSQEQIKEQARNILREQLRIKNCSCENIQIVEIENKQKQERIAYQITEIQEGKILGLFKHKIQIQANVDVETGEMIQLKSPWYTVLMVF